MKITNYGTLALCLLIAALSRGHCQNTLQFTSVNPTPENAIQLHWASNTNEVYEIDYADQLNGNDDGSTAWNKLYDDYPSQGTNTFWLDAGNFNVSPYILHPKNSPMRFYRVLMTATNTDINPTITITSPSNGATVASNLTVQVSASSSDILAVVKLYVDGQEMPPSNNGTNFIINTCEWWNGSHTLFATAKSLTHFEGLPNDTSIAYGHAVSPYVNVTFNNLITEAALSQPYFEPSLGQTQEVTASFGANCNWTLRIQDINKNVVRTVTGVGNSLDFNWDGTGDGEASIPDGVYTYLISAQTNGLANSVVTGGSGGSGGTGLPPMLSMASKASLLPPMELWAAPLDGSENVLPLAILPITINANSLSVSDLPMVVYPFGFKTNGFTIFKATQEEINSLKTPISHKKKLNSLAASTLVSNGGLTSNNDSSPASSSQSTEIPVRPPDDKGKGTIGTFYVGYQDYWTAQYTPFTAPPIQTGYPFFNKWVQLDGEANQTQASHSETFGSIYENADIANGFSLTMQTARWKGSVNSFITAPEVTGGIFNNANVGLLCVHASYGTTAESDGVMRSYLRFFSSVGQGPTYCRLDDCNFGGSGTNGLKWMAILACSVLYNSDYNNLFYYGRLPINNDLHLLLTTSTVASASPTLGLIWAEKMLGDGTTNRPPETVEQSWFDAGSIAYIPETNHITITFRVSGWPAAFSEHLSDINASPSTGNVLDITKQDATVFSNP